MAGSRVATRFHEYGHNVEFEADWPFGRSPLNLDRDYFRLPPKGNLELGLAVLDLTRKGWEASKKDHSREDLIDIGKTYENGMGW